MTTLTAATPSAPGNLWPTGPRRPAATPSAGFTAGDVLRAARERMVLVLFVWFFLIGVTVGLTYLWIIYYPRYETSAFVRVETTGTVDPLEEARNMQAMNIQTTELMVKDQTVFVKNPDVLRATVEDPEVKATQWFKKIQALGDPTRSVVDELDEIIEATPITATSFMQVSVHGTNPKELPTLVNTVVTKYIGLVNDVQKARYREELERLRKETGNAEKLLDQKNAELDAFRAQLPASIMSGVGANPITEKLQTLTALQVELGMQKLGRKRLYETLTETKSDDLPITPEMQNAIDMSPQIIGLRQRLDEAESAFRNVSAQYGANHRFVKSLRTQVEQIRQNLQSAELEKLADVRNQFVQTARNDYFQAQEQEQALAEEVEVARSEQRDLDAKIARYVRGAEERETLKLNFDALQRQRELLDQQLRRDKTVRVSSVGSAQPPNKRSQPRWILNLPIGVVVGLLLAVGLAVLLDLADRTVRTPRDVQRHAAMAVLANIPNLDDEEVEIGRIELASVDAPHSVIAEAFRQLRTNLFFSAPVEHQGAILVTSSGAEDGKTTVALNLAAAIAVSGRRVLLIDANFRRPGLRRVFPGLRAEGLSNVLIGQARLADVVSSSEIPSLDLVNTGPTPPNPAELLGSSYLRDLIADARGRYDQIIFDGPPVLLVSDALVLAGAVDGVVMVCRFRSTSRGALLRARTQLDAINARILGAVLNGVRSTRGGYYRKLYREMYEYQADEEGGAPVRLDVAEARPRTATADSKPAIDEGPGALERLSRAEQDDLARQIEQENRQSAKGDRDEDSA